MHSRKGLVIVVALPMLLAGLVLIARGADKFYTYFNSGSWPKVKANIINAEIFHTERDSRNRSTVGVRGSFSYEFNNQRYTSSNFDIVGGSNTNPDEKKAKLAILLEAKAQGKQLDAYVNPSDPTYAFIFREISFDMFGYILIGLISSGLGYVLCRFSRLWPSLKPSNPKSEVG